MPCGASLYGGLITTRRSRPVRRRHAGEALIFLDLFAVRLRLEALRSDRHRATVGTPGAVDSLAMVASSSWQWPVDPATGTRHGDLLRGLVARLTGDRFAVGRGPAPDGTARNGRRSRSTPDPASWTWALGERAGESIEHVATALGDLCRRAAERGLGAVESDLSAMKHRVYLHGSELWPDDLDFHVVLDFAFTTYLQQLTCVLKVSLESRYPRHAPDEFRVPHEPEPGGAPIADYVDLFDDVRTRMEDWFAGSGLHRTEFRIQGREYRLPTIWVGIPARPEPDAVRYLRDSLPMLNDLAALTLRVGDARDCVITPSVLNGQVLALRHLESVPANEPILQPNYLLVPESVAPNDPLGRGQEELIAQVIQALILLEGLAAERFWHIHADVDVWIHQLNVYDRVAERGLVLWDALSTHLPVRRGRELERVHRSVELIHQILLQGVADLARMETRTQDCLANAARATEELLEAYDGVLTEFHDTRSGLRTALAQTGVAGEVRLRAERAVEQAARVKAKYDHLLGAMSHAFDERRVRESDVLQRASGKIGFALAFIGGITVLDATVQMKPDGLRSGAFLLWNDAWLSRAALVASVLFGLGFLASVCWVAVGTLGEGPLGSRRFRRIYNGRRGETRQTGMWHFLRDSSSDELDQVKARSTEAPLLEWRKRDDDLSARFAVLWDEIAGDDNDGVFPRLRRRGAGEDLNVASDIRSLAQRIEQWGLRTLLVTERPFGTLSRYRVPRLTLLYRACTLLPDSFLTGTGVNVVSEDDCRRSLQQLGLTPAEAAEVDAALVRRVGAQQATAQDVITLLDQWDVHADMDADRVARLLAKARTSAIDATKPAPPEAARASE